MDCFEAIKNDVVIELFNSTKIYGYFKVDSKAVYPQSIFIIPLCDCSMGM